MVSLLIVGTYSCVSDFLERFRSRRLLDRQGVPVNTPLKARATRLEKNGVAGEFEGTFQLVPRPNGVGYTFEILDRQGSRRAWSQDTALLRLAEEGSDVVIRWEYEGNDLDLQTLGYKGVMECRLTGGKPVLLKYFNNRPSAGWMEFP
jgi:hypothetical protein